MNNGNITSVGMFVFAASFTPIMYAKYARVNVNTFTLRGNLEIGPFFESDNASHIWFRFPSVFKNGSSGNAAPIDIVIKQFNNNIDMKMTPLISELNIDDRPKKLTNINGANRNPMYIMDLIFSASTIFGEE